MKKIMFSGLAADVTEEKIRESLARFGPINQVNIFRDGDPNQPIVVVEMEISDAVAFKITSRVTDLWHDGQRVNARMLLH